MNNKYNSRKFKAKEVLKKPWAFVGPKYIGTARKIFEDIQLPTVSPHSEQSPEDPEAEAQKAQKAEAYKRRLAPYIENARPLRDGKYDGNEGNIYTVFDVTGGSKKRKNKNR